VVRYDQELGISYWSKNYRTGLDGSDGEALNRVYPFYDPIDRLPASGQQWWRKNAESPCEPVLSIPDITTTTSDSNGNGHGCAEA
jgi:lysine 2,3-aminomutase